MMSSAVRRAPSHWYLGLDRGLPELAAAFDLPAVSRLYEERWPGRARPGLGVRARKVHDVEYQPSARCVVAHELTLQRGGDEPVETIGVVEVRPAARGLASCNPSAMCPTCTCSSCRRWRGVSSIPSLSTRRWRARRASSGCARPERCWRDCTPPLFRRGQRVASSTTSRTSPGSPRP